MQAQIRKPRVGLVDLQHSPWQGVLQDRDSAEPHEIHIKAEQGESGVDVSMKICLGGKEVNLGTAEIMSLVKELVQALFFTTGIPESAVPEALRGNLQASQMWAAAQAQSMIPFMLQSILSPTVINGEPFQVDFAYMPNVSSSNIVGIDGKKKATWDGTFRPVLRLVELPRDLPEYVGGARETE